VKQIRLLPVVIVATLALLLLKGIGLVTEGGYVLTGTNAVFAAGGGGDHGGGGSAGGDLTLVVPEDPTLEDASPTLEDNAVTLPLGGEAEGGHGDAGAHGEAAPAEHGDAGAHGETAPAEHGEAAPHGEAAAPAAPEVAAAVDGPLGVCPPDPGDAATEEEGTSVVDPENCVPIPVNEAGDAIALVKDGAGNMVPLTGGDGSDAALTERLAERREELDTRAAELEMRLALVEAAEKRIEERTAALEALEARINAMVDEKRTLEEAQFVAVVSMYETMKPKDAAAIFDQLDMSVLLRVARAINPRKMAPIMAKMDPMRAKDLTAGLAVDQVEPTIDMADETVAELPQIVGQ
jgi:flagellar motility protein MotE (MotC chaperone)